MKTHLNTLFVTTEGTYLAKAGQSVAIRVADDADDADDAEEPKSGGKASGRKPKKTKLRVPLHNLDGIVAFGRVSASPQLLHAAAEQGLTVSFLSPRGRFRYAAVGYSPGNVLIRREQYRWADDPDRTAAVVRSVVLGKLANSRTVLKRAARESAVPEAATRLSEAANQIQSVIGVAKAGHEECGAETEGHPPDAGSRNSGPVANACYPLRKSPADFLRGLEGGAAARYFAVFDDLLRPPADADGHFRFTSRSRRPPLDPVNALLSFLYSLLTHDTRSACEATGLDAAVGFLHRDRPGRPSLALDLIEELRPVLADRLAVTLINRGQITTTDFDRTASGAVHLSEAGRKTVLQAWQTRKREQVRHPYLDERMSWGLVPHIQARLLARHLRGELDAYPPFLWK